MPETLRETLTTQLATAWGLASYHLQGLTDAECHWRPAQRGMHVWPVEPQRWRADWPDHEAYDLGPPSIAWTTWHMIFWWSTALNRNFGDGELARQDVIWPGSADGVRTRLDELHGAWASHLCALADADLVLGRQGAWPYSEASLAKVFAWANIELTKNAAELGFGRFLFAVQAG